MALPESTAHTPLAQTDWQAKVGEEAFVTGKPSIKDNTSAPFLLMIRLSIYKSECGSLQQIYASLGVK